MNDITLEKLVDTLLRDIPKGKEVEVRFNIEKNFNGWLISEIHINSIKKKGEKDG